MRSTARRHFAPAQQWHMKADLLAKRSNASALGSFGIAVETSNHDLRIVNKW